MSKLYYPTPDELRGARPQDSKLWYAHNQPLLVSLLNTQEGADLYCWERTPYPIIRVGSNYLTEDLSRDAGPGVRRTTFRCSPKYSNLTRSRWRDVKPALDRMILESFLQWPRIDKRGLVFIGGGSHTDYFPDPHPETNTVDGIVTDWNAGGRNWTTAVNAAGTGSNDTGAGGAGIFIAEWKAHVNSTWLEIYRGIFLFLTSDLGSDIISSGTFSVKVSAKTNTAGTIALNVYSSNPNSNNVLRGLDYSTLGTTDFSTTIAYASISTSAYNDFALNASGLAAIDPASVTKLGTRDPDSDVADSEPSGGSDVSSTVVGVMSETAGEGSDPKLAVVHAASFRPHVLVF